MLVIDGISSSQEVNILTTVKNLSPKVISELSPMRHIHKNKPTPTTFSNLERILKTHGLYLMERGPLNLTLRMPKKMIHGVVLMKKWTKDIRTTLKIGSKQLSH